MNDIKIWLVLAVASIVLGLVDHKGVRDNKGKAFQFMEKWRHSVGYFISAIVGYYFLSIRWPFVRVDGILSASDFILGIVFLMGVLGWLPYFIKNITEGISAVISKWLK